MRQVTISLVALAHLLALFLAINGQWLGAVMILGGAHAIALWATLSPHSQWWGPTVRHFRTSEKEVWITIDDGPSASDTSSMLELLAKSGHRATFFLVGREVTRNPALARQISDSGNGIGNHSQTHPSGWFWSLPPGKIRGEIESCSLEIQRATGQLPEIFRAPVGMKNPFVHPVLQEHGLQAIGWSTRGFDGVRQPDPEVVVSRLARKLRPGAIILLHEGRSAPDGSSLSLEILRRTLTLLQERGYRSVIPERERFSTAKQ